MPQQSFQISTTTGFGRDVRKLTKKRPDLKDTLKDLYDILKEDPHNISRKYDIKKLEDLKPGEGQWRIRSGDYRLRYDIFNRDVVLYSFRHRKEAY